MTAREYFRKLRAASWQADPYPGNGPYRAGRVDMLAQAIENLDHWEVVRDTNPLSWAIPMLERRGSESDVDRAYCRALEAFGFRVATEADYHDARYVAALLAGKVPPAGLIYVTNWKMHLYQRADGRWYRWPEESLV